MAKVIDVEVPNSVVLKVRTHSICAAPCPHDAVQVVDTVSGEKGNTASGGGTKPATLETGAVITVPLFINVGEEIMVDTRNEVYLSRVGGSSF